MAFCWLAQKAGEPWGWRAALLPVKHLIQAEPKHHHSHQPMIRVVVCALTTPTRDQIQAHPVSPLLSTSEWMESAKALSIAFPFSPIPLMHVGLLRSTPAIFASRCLLHSRCLAAAGSCITSR